MICAVLIVVIGSKVRSPRDTTRFVPLDREAILEEVQLTQPPPIEKASRDGLEPVSERLAMLLYPQIRDYPERYAYDPYRLIALSPNYSGVAAMESYPGGVLEIATNNLGFREDQSTLIGVGTAPEPVRVLFAGDSHIEGVVSNAENVASRLEELAQEDCGAVVEALNAGVGGTGPRNYLGTLQACLELEPSVFVAVLYAGNDFWDTLLLEMFFLGETPRRPLDSEEQAVLRAAKKYPGFFPQGLVQAHRFRKYPDEFQRAVDATVSHYRAMRALCLDNGIHFLAVALPTRLDLLLEDTGVIGDTDQARVFFELGIDREALGINRALREKFVYALRSEGIEVLDVAPRFAGAAAELYWEADHHINIAGHRRLAELVFERLRERICD